MTRATVLALCLVVLAAGFGLTVLVSPAPPGLTAEIVLVVAAALMLAKLVLDVATARPRAEPAPQRPPRGSQRFAQLESVARALDLAEKSSFQLHSVLRPLVREIAAARLTRHGVALDRQPERAEALLGERTWELVRADRDAPNRGSDRGGWSRDELRAIVDSLEAL